ncbi:MAG TPA: alpha/beta hydrolase [Opitutaceae bacterium]
MRLLRPTFAALTCLALSFCARAEPETHTAPTANPTFPEMPASIPLWAGDAPGSEGRHSPEVSHWEGYKAPDGTSTWYPVVSNINAPSITPFLPAPGTGTGAALVVCPGGGHRYLALEHEGYAIGKWFSAHGIATFILRYRLAQAPGSDYKVEVHSLMDAQRAIRLVRSRAVEWRVNPRRVGIVGFSAGGEVAALAATRFDRPVRGSSDAVDALDCRPDFQGLFYPLLPKAMGPFGPRTPPAFLCGASDDGFKLTPPMVRLYLALEEAGVPCEMHVYEHGGHGFGVRDEDKAVYSWMPLFARWVAGQRGR